jgi:hypothetical protein
MNYDQVPNKRIHIDVDIIIENGDILLLNNGKTTDITLTEFAWAEQAAKEFSQTLRKIERRHVEEQPHLFEDYVAIP